MEGKGEWSRKRGKGPIRRERARGGMTILIKR